MAEHNLLGNQGEKVAQKFLESSGYKILEKNWRFGKYEIDLIARKDHFVAIVEVKTRGSNLFENPEDTVSQQQRKRLIEAADQFLRNYPEDVEARFDIIALRKEKEKWEVKHFEDAYSAF